MSKRKYTANKCIVEIECLGQFCQHHIKTRGAGGKDEKVNLMPLCAKHHTEVHIVGLKSFADKYTNVKNFLEKNYEFDEFANKWFLK